MNRKGKDNKNKQVDMNNIIVKVICFALTTKEDEKYVGNVNQMNNRDKLMTQAN